MSTSTLSNQLIRKLSISFLLILLLVGLTQILITFYFTRKYFEETTQRLNAEVAAHLINEKFQDTSPFLEDGTVNKPLFGDIMHDMMAVNRGIEVFLLDEKGVVQYSVVLDNDGRGKNVTQVDLQPIKDFLACNKQAYILGDDPRDQDGKKIFSAEAFEIGDHKGYIYIVLAGKAFEEVTDSLFASYFIRLGVGAFSVTLAFAIIIGLLAIWFLTKSLREIIFTVRRFKEGDMLARVPNPERTDLSILATTFNEMADTIVGNIEKLKSVENLRRELIANVSHDLRTPLAIMQGYVETLQIKDEHLDQVEREKYLGILKGSVDKLSHMVFQLFEYSKLEAKEIEPQKEPFSISDLAMDVYYKCQVLAKKKDIKLELEIEEKLPLVFADISLVERVIQNLMDNALKFTPENGAVTIQLKPSHESVEVMIKDNGPGIPENEQSYIFERYRKTENGKTQSGGAGLGLAIAKKILEINNSTIKVISQPNKGTTFQFGLPVYENAMA
ncbi:HAMP domain-containing sensor histidine kinase [Flammeovirgaceae bacterium SG7u.111]|nr:HAMP domain-containing sensor histidine kinase [Flammeovirgaceae bacterium SG7u.132]WPO35538.1 HAMP domain-containing sensor histidine kinase [Flammeovirgaceae bacterium SG7u.111]